MPIMPLPIFELGTALMIILPTELSLRLFKLQLLSIELYELHSPYCIFDKSILSINDEKENNSSLLRSLLSF